MNSYRDKTGSIAGSIIPEPLKSLFAKRFVCYLVGVYGLMVFLFSGLIFCVYLIPSDHIEDNVVQYYETLAEEGVYPKLCELTFEQRDNFTESWMVGIAFSDTTLTLVERALLNPSYEEIGNPENPLAGLRSVRDGVEGFQRLTYGRYWHGYQVLLRPLLLIFGPRGLRLFNWVIFIVLFSWVTVMLYKRVSFRVSLLFAFCVVVTAMPVVPSCIQYFTCYAIAMTSMGVILTFPRWVSKLGNASIFFLAVGGVTSFLDLLSTPMLTLGLSLITLLLTVNYNNKVQLCCLLILSWSVGYIGLWSAKWILATGLTDQNIISDAFNSILIRTGQPTGPFTPAYLIERLNPYLPSLFLMLTGVITTSWLVRKYHGVKGVDSEGTGWLIVLILLVPTWYLLTRNHSLVHWWFAWRSLTVTLFALGLLLLLISSPSGIGRRRRADSTETNGPDSGPL